MQLAGSNFTSQSDALVYLVFFQYLWSAGGFLLFFFLKYNLFSSLLAQEANVVWISHLIRKIYFLLKRKEKREKKRELCAGLDTAPCLDGTEPFQRADPGVLFLFIRQWIVALVYPGALSHISRHKVLDSGFV